MFGVSSSSDYSRSQFLTTLQPLTSLSRARWRLSPSPPWTRWSVSGYRRTKDRPSSPSRLWVEPLVQSSRTLCAGWSSPAWAGSPSSTSPGASQQAGASSGLGWSVTARSRARSSPSRRGSTSSTRESTATRMIKTTSPWYHYWCKVPHKTSVISTSALQGHAPVPSHDCPDALRLCQLLGPLRPRDGGTDILLWGSVFWHQEGERGEVNIILW